MVLCMVAVVAAAMTMVRLCSLWKMLIALNGAVKMTATALYALTYLMEFQLNYYRSLCSVDLIRPMVLSL